MSNQGENFCRCLLGKRYRRGEAFSASPWGIKRNPLSIRATASLVSLGGTAVECIRDSRRTRADKRKKNYRGYVPDDVSTCGSTSAVCSPHCSRFLRK
jgi:hypothetical protein